VGFWGFLAGRGGACEKYHKLKLTSSWGAISGPNDELTDSRALFADGH
jgi:hypothetical protein